MLTAGRSGDPRAEAALTSLCQAYWRPLYAYVRRRGYSVEEAQDLTQAFFVRFLEKRLFTHARKERGRFRSFLLASLKHFLANEWDRAHSKKRGEGVLDLDFGAAERLVAAAQDSNPEWLFERQWVFRVLESALTQVEQHYLENGQGAIFEALKGALNGDGALASYRESGEKLGLSEGAARVAAHRLRRRYRSALRGIVGQTVADPSDVDEEIRYLLSVLEDRG